MEDDFPTKNRKRALRRHLRMRAKRKARQIAKWIGLDQDRTERNAEHLKNCSCMICGNPRKYWHQPTFQEKREFQEKLQDTLLTTTTKDAINAD